MKQVNSKEIRIVTKNDLYENYPFPYDFALSLLYESPTTLSSNSLKQLLFFTCFLSLYENTNEVVSEDEFFNKNQEIFSCMNTDFLVKNGVLYYFDFDSDIFFSLENLNYLDIITSSLMYIVVQHQKEGNFIPWLAIHEFLLKLKSSYTISLCFFLKKKLCMKNERINCIQSLINALQHNKKKNVLNKIF